MVGLQQTIGSIWITMIIMIFSHIANKNWKLSPWDASEGREVLKHYPRIYFLHLFCEVSPTPLEILLCQTLKVLIFYTC